MKPFLDCNIWSLLPAFLPDGFHLVEKIYHYNSSTDGILDFDTSRIQLPEFEILNLELLLEMDSKIIQDNDIPIIRVDYNSELRKERWRIDRMYYDSFIKLQSETSI